MADKVTNYVADYVDKLGIKVSAISRETGIPDGILVGASRQENEALE